MGQTNTDMDTESLQKSERRRGSCLDGFLVISIIFLFVALTAVTGGGLVIVMDMRSKLERMPSPMASESKWTKEDAPYAAYKTQNFVYLRAASSELQNHTMPWTLVHYSSVSSLGSNFNFDSKQHTLTPEKVGTYFMYIDLNLTCTYKCNAGLLTLQVGDKMTCEVALPAVADSKPVSKKCWAVSRIDGQKLYTQMTVSEGLKEWELKLDSSGFGMFLVD
ncbi:uncharacterized protein LOC113128288 [Mastacembelus armatus]|uniref:uncharacterized protein LOC113128288 n=1 Tax=Mastacembelus armatus TaxID=205130 RepID=UPI000E464B07|nr:uncharacterized protein LOC113128288 [Mastacembelus armatus]